MKKQLSIILSLCVLISTICCVNNVYAASSRTRNSNRNVIVSRWHVCSLVEKKQPTCTAKGYNKYKCYFCKYTVKKTLAPLGHTEVKDNAVSPTCTKAGLTEGSHCSRCKAVIVKQKTVKATGHNFINEVIKATPDGDGMTTTSCTQCGEVSSKEVIKKPIGIKLSKELYEYDGKAKTPSLFVYNEYFEGDNTCGIIDESQYKVEYLNNVNAGIATVKVTFQSDFYEGSMQTTFTIKEPVTEAAPPVIEETTTTKANTYRPKINSVKNVSLLTIKTDFNVNTAYSTYVVQVSRDKSFRYITAKKTVKPRADYLLKGRYTVGVKVTTPGMTYYVRVKAGKYYSPIKAIRVTK